MARMWNDAPPPYRKVFRLYAKLDSGKASWFKLVWCRRKYISSHAMIKRDVGHFSVDNMYEPASYVTSKELFTMKLQGLSAHIVKSNVATGR